jgi:hypothetical protein
VGARPCCGVVALRGIDVRQGVRRVRSRC